MNNRPNNTPDKNAEPEMLNPDQAKRAIDALFRKHWMSLVNLANSIMRNHHDAEDVVAEAFNNVWKKLDSGKLAFPFPHSYLRKTVFNTALNHIKSLKRRTFIHDRAASDKSVANNAAMGSYSLKLLNPEEAIDKENLATSVRASIEELPDGFREAVELCELKDHTYREAAEKTETPIGTIMSRLHRGRNKLKGILTNMANAEPDGTIGEFVTRKAA